MTAMTDQYDLTNIFCSRPNQFAWFLGAGASAVAGLPTANDIIWILKRTYYCQEENQDVSRQDVQLNAVRTRIQSYMLSKGFPAEGDAAEYTTYFQKIFGDDKERQRQYLLRVLSEDKVTLSVGNRILGALLAMGQCRAVFTTNFDSVLERAVAEVSGRSLSAYHLESAKSANNALNSEEYPLYCKLHGDFRYDSIKNLKSDLAAQNADLSQCLTNAANRFGFIVAGYSGRDESVMQLMRSVLTTSNPFPHGLYWTIMKSGRVLPAVQQLIDDAKQAGVNAALIEIETFDALMLRLWRNLENKDTTIDAKVRRSQLATVSIPLPRSGKGLVVGMNAVPITTLPEKCQALAFESPKEWSDLRAATRNTDGELIFTKSDTVLCWGKEALVRSQFTDLVSVLPHDISSKIDDIENNLHIKGFLGEAACRALVRGKPLLTRTTREASYLIADRHCSDLTPFDALQTAVGKLFGEVDGLFTPIDEEHPHPHKVAWAEAVRTSIDIVNGRCWLLLDPDVWIWPNRARKSATAFLDKRRGDRYNNAYNSLLNAWFALLLRDAEPNGEVKISAYEGGTVAETPSFTIHARSAFTRRLGS
jgi:hypothetical protein